ncbi:FkbM family methyltransferase [Leptolyngbya boryana CZ1]|uniref:FkbM family methyltransferase n=1 Tax=Leptolyngbya boryana CZ1 TaxID=3060204 RepID=A0AA97AUZ8_LEPBY|nr:FkbM family methyltransferase [Leptolyngbya boryana]WNZ46990.1 FkbM family methyltransferase [Leptolyngbya boryana CZ1]
MESDMIWLAKTFKNSYEIVQALKQDTALPPLQLQDGSVLFHWCKDWADSSEIRLRGINLFILEVFQEIFRHQIYVKDHFYQPEPSHVVFDVGAHLGFFPVYCHNLAPGIQIHCFEPIESMHDCIEKNAAMNQIDLKIHPYAVWDKAERLEMKKSPFSASLFDQLFDATAPAMHPDIEHSFSVHTDTEFVSCISLAEAIQVANVNHVDLLKLHVEGAEVEIVASTPAEVWQKIDRVTVFCHEFFRPGCIEQIADVLKNQGFSQIVTESIPEIPIASVAMIRAAKLR